MAEMQVFTVISEINNLMETSRKVPLSNLIMLDKQRMDRLLDRLSDSLDPDLEKAEKLLATTDYSLSVISRTCGFSSSSYFSQTFKKITGVSPSCYRRTSKSDQDQDKEASC